MGSAFAAALGQVQLSPFPLQGSALQPLGTFLPPAADFGVPGAPGAASPAVAQPWCPCQGGCRVMGVPGDFPEVMPESGLPSRPGMPLGQEMFGARTFQPQAEG